MFQASIRDAWELIQNNEYLLSQFYDDKEIFPQILGNCGNIFITEYIESVNIQRHNRYINHIDLPKWRYHIKVAVLILDYLIELEQNSLVMCYVDVNNFGIIDNRMKYDDQRYIYTQSTIDRKLSDGHFCVRDEDCSYLNCKSKCNMDRKQCTNSMSNNNLQIICEHIFRGTSSKPGILITEKTPTILVKILDRCVRPITDSDVDSNRIMGPSNKLSKALYNELTNIFENLSTYT